MWNWWFKRRASSRNNPEQMDNRTEAQVPNLCSAQPSQFNNNQQANTSIEIHEETPPDDRNVVSNSTPLQTNNGEKGDKGDKGDKESRRVKIKKRKHISFPNMEVPNSVSLTLSLIN